MKLYWIENEQYRGTYECRQEGDATMLAWIETRNSYCDRGHYKGHIEIGGLDFADCWPSHYMRLDYAIGKLRLFSIGGSKRSDVIRQSPRLNERKKSTCVAMPVER